MKHPLRLLALLALLLTLGGCYTARGETTVEPGGSGTQTLIVAFEEQLNLLSPDELENLKEQVEDSGGEVRDWSEGSYSGFEATWRFERPEQLGELLTGRAAKVYTLDLAVDERNGKRVYSFRNMIDPSELGGDTLDPMAGMPGLDMPGMEFPGLMQPDLRYKLTMPGKITSYRPQSGRRVGENSVEWTLEAGEIAELSAVSEEPLPLRWVPYVVGASLAALLVGALLVFFLRRRGPRSLAVVPAEGLGDAPAAPAYVPARTGPLPEPDAASSYARPLTRAPEVPPRPLTPPQEARPVEPRTYEPPGSDFSKGTPTIPLASTLGSGLGAREPAQQRQTGPLCPHCDWGNLPGARTCSFCGRDLS